MNNPDLEELGKPYRFTKENQPIKKGRRPAQWKKFIKDHQLSDVDRRFMAQVILSAKSKEEIETMLKDSKIPFGVWAACVAALNDAKKGGRGFLKYLYDAGFGKIPDRIITSNEDPEIKDEELIAELEETKKQMREEIAAELTKEITEKVKKEIMEEMKKDANDNGQ